MTKKKTKPTLKTVAKKGAKKVALGKTAKKFKSVDEGNGTVFEALSDEEIRARAMDLAFALHKREEEQAAQAHARKLASERLADMDLRIHRLQTAIREKREERPAPGLFDRLDKAKSKPLAEDTMETEPEDATV